jgi:hypothetical protein
MSGYASYDDALDPKYGEPYKVKLVDANEETLKGYGKIVTDFDKEELKLPHGQLMDGESYTLVPAQWVELCVVIVVTRER